MLVKCCPCLLLPSPLLPKASPQSFSPNLFLPSTRDQLNPMSSTASRVSYAGAPPPQQSPVPNPVAIPFPAPRPDPQRLLPQTTDVR